MPLTLALVYRSEPHWPREPGTDAQPPDWITLDRALR